MKSVIGIFVKYLNVRGDLPRLETAELTSKHDQNLYKKHKSKKSTGGYKVLLMGNRARRTLFHEHANQKILLRTINTCLLQGVAAKSAFLGQKT